MLYIYTCMWWNLITIFSLHDIAQNKFKSVLELYVPLT